MATEFEKALNGVTYFFPSEKGKVPVGLLDWVFTIKNNNMRIRYFSFLDGEEITKENYLSFCKLMKDLIDRKEYLTTDHLFVSVEIDDNVVCIYVSLDNSVRSNMNAHPLYKRLVELCKVVSICVNKFKKEGKECLIFFSESCRPSFDGGDLNNRLNEVNWFRMRQDICRYCDLEYLGESTNNDDPNGMAFGVSAFCTLGCISQIDGIFPRRILTEGFGSGALGVKFVSKKIVWGIHFPLDFKNQGTENYGSKAMVGLSKIMQTHQFSILALGDFNTIPGKIMQSIVAAIPENMELKGGDFPTYFGSYYDTVVPREGETWIPI